MAVFALPTRRPSIGSLCLSIGVAVTLAACGGEEPITPPPPAATVATVLVAPDVATLVSIDETKEFTASAHDASDNLITGKTFTWNSSDLTIATVTTAGVVTALSNGTVDITATTDGITGSATVEIDQQAVRITFTVDPTTVLAAATIAPGVEVSILDALQNAVTESTADVTVAVEPSTHGGTLAGATTVGAIGGTATFPDLAIDVPGRDYTLVASTPDLADVTSAAFTIYSGLPAAAVRFAADGATIARIGGTRDLYLDADDASGDPTLPPAATWTSLNDDVATIVSVDAMTGRATGHRDGQVTITADATGMMAHTLLTVSATGPAGQVTWSWDDFNTNTLNDVWATAADDVWAVGVAGTILHYDGTNWVDETPGLSTNDLFGVWASGPADVWAVGRSTLLHFNGTAWSDRSDEASPDRMTGIWGSAANDVWIVVTTGFGNAGLFHFDGTSWSDASGAIPGTPPGLTAIWGAGADDVWAVGRDGTVMQYDGSTWSNAGPGSLVSEVNDVFGSSATDVWVVADSAAWQNDGMGWVDRTAGITVTDTKRLRAGWSGGAGSVWITAINSGSIWRHNGATWIEVNMPWDINGANGISGSATDDIWAVSNWAEFAHYTGTNWSNDTPRSTNATPLAMWGSSTDDVWAAGASGVMLHYDGSQWTEDDLGASQFEDLWGTGPTDVWAVGSFGKVFHYNGVSWSDVPHGLTGSSLKGVWGSGPDDVWVVGTPDTIFRFDGSVWSMEPIPFPVSFVSDVWGADPNDVWLAGANGASGVLLHYDGAMWTDETPPSAEPLDDVWGTGPEDVWVVGGADMIFHYDGTSWTNTAVGQSGHFRRIWGTGPADVWALGDVGGCCPRWAISLFHYDGTAWSDLTPGSLTWNRILAIWGSRSTSLWAWGESGTRLIGTR